MASITRIRTTFTGSQGAPYVSTQYFAGSDSSAASLAASAVGAFWAALEPVMHNELDWNVEPFAEVINDATGALVGVNPIGGGESGTGEVSGTPLPFATQGLLRLVTSTVVNGRVLRGRIFIPGTTEFVGGNGVPEASYVTALNDAFDALDTAAAGALLVWSRTHGTSAVVTGGQAWNQWAILRSRRD